DDKPRAEVAGELCRGAKEEKELKNERCDAAAEHSEVNPSLTKSCEFEGCKQKALIYQLCAECFSLPGPQSPCHRLLAIIISRCQINKKAVDYSTAL
ncbi:MAG: hypothetical protein J6B27_02165, partial [Alistipes sp.]|nr:hypothetical protein [Alistipes sp.]